MPDMLVKLYQLPPLGPLLEKQKEQNILIKRANPWELSLTREFIETRFSLKWADETSAGFAHQPISVFLAWGAGIFKKEIIGFAAYECTRRNFFGPTGVEEKYRGSGIGKALLLSALWSQWELGYAYSIIGGVGPAEYYKKIVGAILIPDSTPGIYE
jgi:hypothetical protein